MICRHKLYHFTVANTRFTAPLTRRGKTKFATIKWYNLCRQIIQSQTCYPLIIHTNSNKDIRKSKRCLNAHLISSILPNVESKIEKVPRGIRGEKSSKDMASSRNLVSTNHCINEFDKSRVNLHFKNMNSTGSNKNIILVFPIMWKFC